MCECTRIALSRLMRHRLTQLTSDFNLLSTHLLTANTYPFHGEGHETQGKASFQGVLSSRLVLRAHVLLLFDRLCCQFERVAFRSCHHAYSDRTGSYLHFRGLLETGVAQIRSYRPRGKLSPTRFRLNSPLSRRTVLRSHSRLLLPNFISAIHIADDIHRDYYELGRATFRVRGTF